MISLALNIVSGIIAAIGKVVINYWIDGAGNQFTDGNGNYIVLRRREN